MKLLLVEDHAAFAEHLLRDVLSAHEVTWVATLSEGLVACGGGSFDAILVDYDLPDGKGARLVRQLRALEDPTPVVAISAHAPGNEALLEAGATVACPKAEKDRLPEVLAGV
ncbi:MAG: response regulator [Planctomycetota bacterium]